MLGTISEFISQDMTGEKLPFEILQTRLEIPIILSTGFSKKISRQKVLEIGFRKYLSESFSKFQPAATIRELLGRSDKA